MKEPVDHILRPLLPWRARVNMTECGLNADSVPTIDRAAFTQRRKDLGEQRTAMFTCMTCANAAGRWGAWEDDPRKAIEREIQWETAWSRSERGDLLREELHAIAALIESHRDEFDETIRVRAASRAWLERKAAFQKPTVKPKERGL